MVVLCRIPGFKSPDSNEWLVNGNEGENNMSALRENVFKVSIFAISHLKLLSKVKS